MTPTHAREVLEDIFYHRYVSTLEKTEALLEAMEALGKQEPQAPTIRIEQYDYNTGYDFGKREYKFSRCGCGRAVVDTFRFCPVCGQALDFTKEEENDTL